MPLPVPSPPQPTSSAQFRAHIERGHEGLSRHYYNFEFAETGAPEPEAGEAAEAEVVIVGTDQNGRRTEIRGKGWLGFSDHGRVEGHFESPPVMLTGDGPEMARREAGPPDRERSLARNICELCGVGR